MFNFLLMNYSMIINPLCFDTKHGLAVLLLVSKSWAHVLVNNDCGLNIYENNTDIEGQVMESNIFKFISFVVNDTIVVILGATESLIICNENSTIENGRVSTCGIRCGNNGKCRINKKGTPIENIMYENISEMRTKFTLMYLFWGIVVLEIAFLFVGVTSFTKRRFFEPRVPPQRFVDKLRRKAHQQKLNISNNAE
uniref:Dispersed gene family protein 1 (DGF-1) n=1 Tax=Heterorhabditis bacteriophora TaxID=37862 RepID=A0A1I7XFC7_HETBA